jgi:hypothetical protein
MNSRLYRRSLPTQTKTGGGEAAQKGCGKVALLVSGIEQAQSFGEFLVMETAFAM